MNYILLTKPKYAFYKFIYMICKIELGIKIFSIYIDKGYNIILIDVTLFCKVYLEVFI